MKHSAKPPRIAVAASGGRDSTALLHATARAARGSSLTVHALHVHHGLMPQADDWWRHLQDQCVRWARRGLPVRFHGRRLEGAPASGDSVEAWARRERYAALADMAREQGVRMVMLAHHRQDQAETVVLQALRGAGPAGLSAMPVHIERDGIEWVRPWLEWPASAVAAYARRHRLRFVHDPSNEDGRYARSRLRQTVWPVFEGAFPGLEAAMSAVARRMQEAQAALIELTRQDAHLATEAGALTIAVWSGLSAPRRALLLRHWAAQWSSVGMPETLLARLMLELPRSRPGHRWPAPGGVLQRDRLRLYFVARAMR